MQGQSGGQKSLLEQLPVKELVASFMAADHAPIDIDPEMAARAKQCSHGPAWFFMMGVDLLPKASADMPPPRRLLLDFKRWFGV
jgi:hypothetical protein